MHWGARREEGLAWLLVFRQNRTKACEVITGAYRSTPVKVLGAESNRMPIGIVLAQRAANFDAKATAESGKWAETWSRCQRLVEDAREVKRRRGQGRLQSRWRTGMTGREIELQRKPPKRNGLHCRKWKESGEGDRTWAYRGPRPNVSGTA